MKKPNPRILDLIEVLIKVLAESPHRFREFVNGYFAHTENLEEQEDLFTEFDYHLSLLMDEENHIYFELRSLELKNIVGQALKNFVGNIKYIPNNRFAKRFVKRLIDFCQAGYNPSAAVDAHPLAYANGYYS
ncbi:MAG: hypothetical protein HY973_02220 [Candidatus Kerfeldbacteria bacterium]|nr:hypothetical protein [Candidatus Kerfeldbacteria bacterium]